MTAGFHIGIAAQRLSAGWAAKGCVSCFMVQPRRKLIPQDNVTKAPARPGGWGKAAALVIGGMR